MKTIIIGVGNPILSDDSVGIKIARLIENTLSADHDIDITELCAGGVRLMETLVGYDRAIIIDAISTDDGIPGSVYSLSPHDIMISRNIACAHDTDLAGALEMGKSIGLPLPEDISIWAVEVEDASTVSEDLTESVERAVPVVADKIISELGKTSSAAT